MNKIRLFALLTGLVLIIFGFAKIILAGFSDLASAYTPAVLITIGGMLIIAVRRK